MREEKNSAVSFDLQINKLVTRHYRRILQPAKKKILMFEM